MTTKPRKVPEYQVKYALCVCF